MIDVIRRKINVDGVEATTIDKFPDEVVMQDLIKKLEINHAAHESYRLCNGYVSVPTDVSEIPFADLATNENRSLIEVWNFNREKPNRYICYLKTNKKTLYRGIRGVATTWTGDFLGVVIFSHSYKSNMGDTRCNVWLNGINGIQYYGVWCTSVDSCRFRKLKAKTSAISQFSFDPEKSQTPHTPKNQNPKKQP